MLFGGLMKTRRAVDAVRIGEPQRAVAALCRTRDQVLGQRRSFEEAEGAPRPELDIGEVRNGLFLRGRSFAFYSLSSQANHCGWGR